MKTEENDATFHPYFITKTKPQEVLTPGVSIPYPWSCDHIERRGLTPPWAGLLPVAFSPSCCPTTCRCSTRLPLPKQKARMMLLHAYFVTSPHAEGSAARTVYQNRPDSTRFAASSAKREHPVFGCSLFIVCLKALSLIHGHKRESSKKKKRVCLTWGGQIRVPS